MSRLHRFIAFQMMGQTADALLMLTLAQVVVFDLHDGINPTTLARVLITAALPYAVIGPIAARIADRGHRHRRLAATSALRAIVAGAPVIALWTADTRVGYAAGSLLLTIGGVAATLRWAAIPHVVGNTRLVAANAGCSLAQRAAGALGGGIGTALLFVSPVAAVVVAGVLHGAAALGYATFPGQLSGDAASSGATHRPTDERPLRQGLNALVRTAETRPIFLSVLLQRAAYGGVFVTFLLVMADHWALDASLLLVLVALAASGTTLAGVVSAPVTRAFGYRWPCVAAFVLPAVGLAASSVHQAPWLTVGSVALGSLGFQLTRLITDSTIHHHLDEGVRGRAFASYDLMSQVAYLVGGLVALGLPGRGAPEMFAWVALTYAVGIALPLQVAPTWTAKTAAPRDVDVVASPV